MQLWNWLPQKSRKYSYKQQKIQTWCVEKIILVIGSKMFKQTVIHSKTTKTK